MRCSQFDDGRCRSCTLIRLPYARQVAEKVAECTRVLGDAIAWAPVVTSPEAGFRNKAKMVVAGRADEPTIGILDDAGAPGLGVDLRTCGLYPPPVHAALAAVAGFITRARLVPYDVGRRTGELKQVQVVASPDDELLVRFVCRSQEPVTRIRKHLPGLLDELPGLRVASVNLLPEHKAAIQGDREIALTEAQMLRMRINDINLYLRPASFFQTNTAVAAALYRQVRAWVQDCGPAVVWDLFCGVGGFALHVADGARRVVGVETSAAALACARLSAAELGLVGSVTFLPDDAARFALRGTAAPDLVIVNPPRRGIGPVLARWLETSGVRRVIYSSCNAVTLARDLREMPSLRPRRARVLDMFPHTTHYEVVTLLERA